jgi:hypothetical protein
MISLTFIIILLHAVIIIRLLTADKREAKPNRLYEPTMTQVIGFCLLVLVLAGFAGLLALSGILAGYLGDWLMRKNGQKKHA